MRARGWRRVTKRPTVTVTYCIVPFDLASLHDALRRFYSDDPSVEVIVERRAAERRGHERRLASPAPAADERRRLLGRAGRRVAEQRAEVREGERPLPAVARAHAGRLRFVVRLEPSSVELEDISTTRIVVRYQSGDRDAFSALYMRYFDRVYAYMRVALGESQGAEDATQQVFIRLLERLSRYERREQPFRAWLFTIVRHIAIDELRTRGRLERVDLRPVPEPGASAEAESTPSDWLSDRDLRMLVERLPLAQRQVLLLRFMLDLPHDQVAQILGRTPDQVRTLQARALRFLNTRLSALRSGSRTAGSGSDSAPRRAPSSWRTRP
jgi:RNA polymerase sigma-70 factor (ECF subfamily)